MRGYRSIARARGEHGSDTILQTQTQTQAQTLFLTLSRRLTHQGVPRSRT